MTIGTLARYLIGERRAIEEIAASRWSLLIGFLLMLTGGLARNYDGAYLPAEWPVLLHGPVVSVVNAFVLFAWVWIVARVKRGGVPPFVSGYLAFLGLFWLTTPLAWAYAIPYERFLSPAVAVEANLWTLAAVSLWRVALMTRVLSVLYRCAAAPVATFVLLFADVAVFAAARLAPAPIVDLMGGLQHNERDAILAGASFAVTVWSLLLMPVFAIAALTGTVLFKPGWASPTFAPRLTPKGLIGAAVVALLAWIPLLTWAQPEQRLRWRAEELLKSGRVAEGLREMSEHRREDYPPIWDPPPRLGYGEGTPSTQEIRAALESGRFAPWVVDEYMEKSWRDLERYFVWERRTEREDREAMIETLEARGKDLASQPEEMAEKWQGLRFHLTYDPRLSEPMRERLKRAMAAVERERAALEAADAAAKRGK